MAEGSTDAPREGQPKRQASRRVRVRLKEGESGRFRKKLRKLYLQHRVWFVPLVILVLGTVTIWFALKLYIGE